MSRLDELPPDQRAALSVLLRARKRYGEVAAMLGIAERAVHDRAHAALAVLAPREARGLEPSDRELIGDYLLGQQDAVADRLRTRTLLASSPAANSWAHALAAKLAPEAPAGLPEIPAAGPAPAQSPSGETGPPPPPAGTGASQRTGGRRPASGAGGMASSRLGGALLLLLIRAAVVVAVVLLTKGGGEKKHTASGGSTAAATGTGSAGGTRTGTGTTGTTGAGASSGKARVLGRFPLKAASAGSRSTGSVRVLAEGSTKAFFIEAEHIAASKGFFYAVWLYNSPTSALALSKAPSVGSSHKLSGAALLPSNAGEYREILLTQETSTKPTQPGNIVLRGTFSVSG
ncbi:MAG: hypothetical protein ACYDC2_01650 [Solirubrobacteraceae bacterium]